jgi:hypothetical protein
MDIFDTLYLGTPANQALDAPLPPVQKRSMIGSAYYGLLNDDERLKAEFLEDCRSLEGRVHS